MERDLGAAIGAALGIWVLPLSVLIFLVMVATAVTIADMATVPGQTWRTAGPRYRLLRWAVRLGFVLVPLGLAASVVWWLRAARALRPLPLLQAWKAAATPTMRKFGVFFTLVGLNSLLFGLVHATDPDPSSVYITRLGHDIEPRAYIAAHCPASVAKVGHLDRRPFSGNNPDFERWDVTPRPGHVDVVLLDAESGDVICP